MSRAAPLALAAAALLAAASPLAAQSPAADPDAGGALGTANEEAGWIVLDGPGATRPGAALGRVEKVERLRAATAEGGAVLRALDRMSGSLSDIELGDGETATFGRLAIRMGECRYPVENPSGDAYGYLEIRDEGAAGETVFQGWMIASSPALNALDHPRYDVWVLRCSTS